MNLHEIISTLEVTQGTIAKQAVLDSFKDHTLLKNFIKATLDPGINYYLTKLPKPKSVGKHEFGQGMLNTLIGDIATRGFSGDYAKNYLAELNNDLTAEGQRLLAMLLTRKLGKSSVGETMVLKTWPGLFFTVPYQRCSLLDKKARERFGKLKQFFVQTKADGMFAYVVKRLDGSVDVITRQGSKFPQWFAEKLTYGLAPGKVLVGELLVGECFEGPDDVMLDRKTANGILNSCLKDGDGLEPHQRVRMEAWDLLTQEEFEAGKSARDYDSRYDSLFYEVDKMPGHVSVIQTDLVSSLEAAFAIYQKRLQEGLEGCIIKDPASLWKDGTAKDMVKLKIKFMVEMRVNGMYEGEGKAAGMLGGVYIESEDGGIQNACGSGFNDAQRKLYWEQPWLIEGCVVAIEANDIMQSRDERKKPSLSLPIFIEVRNDKTVADTTERIYAQLEAAKQG